MPQPAFPDPDAPISVYMTFPSRDEADRIAAALVGEGLAACVTLLPRAHSTYRWQGRVETAEETVALAKTSAGLFSRLESRVKAMHSYDCPCILAWPIVAGHRPYLDWLAATTEAKAE